MSTLLATERRIAALLIVARAAMRRGSSLEQAAATIGVPASTLREWLTQLARAEQRRRL